MKNFFILISLLILLSNFSLHSQSGISDYALNNSNFGKEFIIAIPQNEDESVNMKPVALTIYALTYEDATITLSSPSKDISITKSATAFTPVEFSLKDGDIDFSLEVLQSEEVTDGGLIITSDKEMAVWLISEKEISAEGFMAIPTHSWGKKYVHCSFSDINEGQNNRAGAFLIIADQDDTNIAILLKGIGDGNQKNTVKGKKIGETITAKLNRGQTFLVRGSGRTKDFDMSGTQISANKPIGVISYHMRVMIPYNADESRQFIAEMLPPVQSWGKKFMSVEYNRLGKGDYFRLIAAEDDTKWSVKYYNMQTKALFGEKSGTLTKAGDFFHFNGEDYQQGVQKESIKGAAYWEADKPVMLIQYAYSKPWDGDKNWKPVMTIVPPVEQYVGSTVLLAAVTSGFNLNDLTIFAVGDPKDSKHTLLKSIKLGNWELDYIEENNLPGTNLYWYKDFILGGNGVRKLTSKTRLAGYINGFSIQNVYSWMLATGLNKLDEIDELPPIVTINDAGAGIYNVKITELRNGQPKPEQIDQGISKVVLDKDESFNFDMGYQKFDPQNKVTELDVKFTVIDMQRAAKAVFCAMDRAGNISCDSIIYSPGPSLGLAVDDWNAGEVQVGKKVCSNALPNGGIKIENLGTETITINEFAGVSLPFSISSPSEPTLPITMAPGQIVYFKSACFEPSDTTEYLIEVTLKTDKSQFDVNMQWFGKGFIPVSVDDNNGLSHYTIISPNPAADYVELRTTNSGISLAADIQIYNALGELMLKYDTNLQNQYRIDLSGLSSGLYYIKIGDSFEKLIILR